ncbi:hypothetical protein RQP46_002276 [Phenoliferia psychrophenolica]
MRGLSFLFLSGLGVASASLTYKGFDISSVGYLNDAGYTYKTTTGKTRALETILSDAGANSVRSRLWVNPTDTSKTGVSNLAYNLKLGKRAKAAGLSFFLDIHYSDSWADPSQQTVPAAWSSLSTDALVTEVGTYTKSVLQSFVSADIPIAIVSIGNEISDGLLWPVGKVPNYSQISRLLQAASKAVRATMSSAKIAIHLNNGWDQSLQLTFYEKVLAQGYLTSSDFDIQAVSFYPFYGTGATYSALGKSAAALVAKYNKEFLVAETDFPESCSGVTLSESITPSAAGQKKWMTELISTVEAIPSSKGVGIFWWEPAWLNNTALGSSCADSLLFEADWSAWPKVSGTARSSVNMFA